MTYITPKPGPQVLQTSVLWMRVCVPNDWSDEEIQRFAEHENPSSTSEGWRVAKGTNVVTGSAAVCQCDEYPNKVHVVLDTLFRTTEEATR